MMWDGKVIYGDSPIGVKIENHLPDSLNWKIQLWTLKDCIKFCGKELRIEASEATIRDLEPIMIRNLRPAMNGIYNRHYHTLIVTPVYGGVFGKNNEIQHHIWG